MAEPTTPFEAFIRPARDRAALWRTLLGCITIAVVWGLVTAALPLAAIVFDWQPRTPAALTLAVLYLFGGMIVGAAVAVRLLHRRSVRSLLGPGGFRFRRFAGAGAVIAVLSALGFLLFQRDDPVVQAQPVSGWLLLLPFGLLGVLLQTAAEEIVFRGYLLQQLAVRFRARIVWLGLPALLFGLLHWDPATHGSNAWLVVAAATLIGLIFGDVTARYGDLSPAMGLHFVNNVFALLVVAPPAPLAGLSLFLLALDAADESAMRLLHLMDIASMLALYGAWLAIWGRRLRLHSRDPANI